MQIAEKIRKLIAHEQSARSIGNLAEAETFAAKIQDLLLLHKLSMSDVELQAEPIESERAESAQPRKRMQTWSYILAVAAARACLCEAVGAGSGNGIIFIGRGADRQIAASIWRFLTGVALELAPADLAKILKRSKMHPLKARDRYLRGFARAIAMRLYQERKRTVAHSSVTGIIRVDQEQKALEAFKSSALKLKTASIAPIRDSLAFRTGFARGAATPLRKQHMLEVPR